MSVEDLDKYEQVKGAYVITPETMRAAKEQMIVMHPLPRVDEIHPDVDATPFAYYFQQAANGVYARQAILSLVLNEEV